MVEVKISETQWWPTYEINDKDDLSSGKKTLISEELLEEWENLMFKFYDIQEKLERLYNDV